ncbi:retinol dehydrogenase 13 isoform X5 [Rattus norvegicus]|uniref:retinol dehydrogenase 13 isoform X5 n=1 Tax=Rattus norvegicus TaxID=10116 RepID=UPI0019177813|nr:retinol dehydrogenase 13 isoform X4 [Rattus norvegicus]
MNRFLLPVSVVGTVIGGTVLLKDYVAGGACPSKATIPGRTVIVTGANTGIGKQTALELAKRGGNIILACRDREKCEAAAKDIRGETLNPRVRAEHLDLASLKSIREFAGKIIKEAGRSRHWQILRLVRPHFWFIMAVSVVEGKGKGASFVMSKLSRVSVLKRTIAPS